MTVNEDAQVIAGALAAGFRDDDDGFTLLFQRLDKDERRLLYALLELDGALLRTLAEKSSKSVPSIVDDVADTLEATKRDRAGRERAWPPEAWDAGAIVIRMLGDAATASETTTMNKPQEVTKKAWLTGWYIVAWALTIDLAEHEGMHPEEMAQSIALNYAHWTDA